MKFKTRMIISYMSIALILSAILGFIVYSVSIRYEDKSRENAEKVIARQLVSQMEDRLGRMDSIINYILSDPNILRGITILGMDDGSLRGSAIADAEAAVSTGLTTDYIIHNTHRTAFYNQKGNIYSSYASDISNQRLNPGFSIDSLDYLKCAEAAKGKSVIIGVHKDSIGAYDGKEVYSLVKAIQGYRMGFLETENTIESIGELDISDEQSDYYIFINDGELLYGSSGLPENFQTVIKGISDGESRIGNGYVAACSDSRSYDLKIYVLSTENRENGRLPLMMMSAGVSSVVFLIGMIFVLIWSNIMSRPVTKLKEIMESTNLENLNSEDRRSMFAGDPDEFRALSESYQAMTERLDKAVENERRSSILFLQAQFDTLQTQVNPHFIYNVLNIISGRGIMDDDMVIPEMCGSLAEMLRYSTSNKERYATVGQELNYLENYFYLIKRRYEDRFQYSVDVKDDVRDRIIPKMVLQQLVENSLSHGYGNDDSVMNISVGSDSSEEGWKITVRDNGRGFDEDALKDIREKLDRTKEKVMNLKNTVELEIGGMGIVNTYARCLLLFGDGTVFEIENTADGAQVTVGEKR